MSRWIAAKPASLRSQQACGNWPIESAAGSRCSQVRILSCRRSRPAAASAAFCRRPAASGAKPVYVLLEHHAVSGSDREGRRSFQQRPVELRSFARLPQMGRGARHDKRADRPRAFRDECLSMEWFRNRVDARIVIENWRWRHNEVRSHSSGDRSAQRPSPKKLPRLIPLRWVCQAAGSARTEPSTSSPPHPQSIRRQPPPLCAGLARSRSRWIEQSIRRR
jgi:hypothetical protein